MHLKRVNNCALIKVTDSYHGMIEKCGNYVAYGEIDEPTLSKLISKRGVGLDAKEILSGALDNKKLAESMPLRLHPPRHGFKSTKLSVKQGGDLGYLGAGINALISRMI